MQNRSYGPETMGDVYASFADFDGFAADTSHASSQSTATTSVGIDSYPNVQQIERTTKIMMNDNWGSSGLSSIPRRAHAANGSSLPSRHVEQRRQQRDQQIFRRKGGDSAPPPYSSTSGHGEERPPHNARGALVFESYEASNGYSQVTGNIGGNRAVSQRETPDDAGHVYPVLMERSDPRSRNTNYQTGVTNNRAVPQKRSGVSKRTGPGPSMNAASVEKTAPVSPPGENLNSSPRQLAGRRKPNNLGNKLSFLFSNKQQQKPKPQPHGRQHDTTNRPQHLSTNSNTTQMLSSKGKGNSNNPANMAQKPIILKQNPQVLTTQAVQFNVPPIKQQQNYAQTLAIGNPSTGHFTSHSHEPYPAISPARSNTQSSVTVGSAESSYCPSGWPGTVDKRGRAFVMGPSYSESEESSASPQRRNGRPGPENNQQKAQSYTPDIRRNRTKNGQFGLREASRITHQNYPEQHSRREGQAHSVNSGPSSVGFSFDGDSTAELEDWVKGELGDDVHDNSNEGHKFERRNDPIDLDDAFQRRADGNAKKDLGSNNWKEGERDSRTGASEPKTAADFHLEAALAMTLQTRSSQPDKGATGETVLPNNTHATIQLQKELKRQQLTKQHNTNHNGIRRIQTKTKNSAQMHNLFDPDSPWYDSEDGSSGKEREEMPMDEDERGFIRRSSQPNEPPTEVSSHAVRNKYSSFREGGSSYSSSSSTIMDEESKLRGIDTSMSEQRVLAAGRRIPSPKIHNDEADFGCSSESFNNSNTQNQIPLVPQPPTEETLRLNDSRSSAPRPGGSTLFKGYRGFIDKTKDVPNLIDDLESEASTSFGPSGHSYDARQRASNIGLAFPSNRNGRFSPRNVQPSSLVSFNADSGSDVFDGVHSSASSVYIREELGPMEKLILDVNSDGQAQHQVSQHKNQTQGNYDHKEISQSSKSRHIAQQGKMNGVYGKSPQHSHEPNALSSNYGQHTSSQSRKPHQAHRAETEGYLDPSLDISAARRGSTGSSSEEVDDIDELDDDFESFPDLSIYYVQPQLVRKMVRAFRKICTSLLERSHIGGTKIVDIENLEDTKKAFALFEMRSRIMETDIDRGLERRGGTNVVDDIVLTPHFQASQRVRDAVIVSKAWRDGATPKDVVTAHLLTRRSSRAYFVRRPIRIVRRPGNPFYFKGPQFWLEEVRWLDDTDFMLMKCQSLGPGMMKGFEMFTIGDCQSILLKMTSDNCTQLRRELRMAMMRQIEAEEFMQQEIDLDGDENVVADAEQIYRDATVEVKSLSMKLVLADKAFTLVRNRMEKLVETIESLLVRIENDDESVDESYSSTDSDYRGSDDLSQDDESLASEDIQERERIIQRANRAEIAAEVAVRETLLAKQEAEKIRADKQREIDQLREKLAEMETKSQHLASENRRLAGLDRYSSYVEGNQVKSSYLDKLEAKSFLESTYDKDIEDARQAARSRVKTKFKERRAELAKSKEMNTSIAGDSLSTDDSRRDEYAPKATVPRAKEGRSKQRLNGEEFYQHLDFYSRSLRSVSINK